MDREVPPQERLTPEFAARRDAARAKLDAIDPHRQEGGAEADPLRRDWFESVYSLAEGDAAGVPWGDLAPHPLLVDWLAQEGSLAGLRALDVGCGLGDNAEALAAAGAKVQAFDFVETAIDWAKRRFPQSTVEFRTEDLFALPAEWRGAFDLVHESYTLAGAPRDAARGGEAWLPWSRRRDGLPSSPGRRGGRDLRRPALAADAPADRGAGDGGADATVGRDALGEGDRPHWRAVFRRG